MPLVTLPQFTETETKIAGPLTFKQFLSLLIVGGVSFLVYTIFPRSISFFLALIIFVLGIAFSFLKVEGIPLYLFFLLMLKTIFSPRVLFWGKKRGTSPFLAEREFKKIEKEKIGVKRESALKSLITKVETKK